VTNETLTQTVDPSSLADADAPGEQDTARVWTRLAPRVPAISEPALGGGSGRWLLLAAATVLVAATLLTLGLRDDSRLTFELRGASSQSGWIDARRGEATVALSDGSSILAENSTRFRVDVLGTSSALTELASGKLHVRVAHNPDTSYRFLAGPYEVRVVGTEFDLAWEPNGSGLSLSMAKGRVRLLEPGGRVRYLTDGQTVRLPVPEPTSTADVRDPRPQ
jgi:ferric-dicitrate binding protein FerR (iron transport regulator)